MNTRPRYLQSAEFAIAMGTEVRNGAKRADIDPMMRQLSRSDLENVTACLLSWWLRVLEESDHGDDETWKHFALSVAETEE